MLQLSLVCERWPLAGLGRLRSGIAALALAWGVGIGAYFLFVNLNAVPAAARAAAGLRNPGGPIPGPDFGSALIAVGVWQAVFFIALRGWPVNTISQQASPPDRGERPRHRPRRGHLPGAPRRRRPAARHHQRRVRATADDWVTTAALSFIGAGIILHVGIGLRWPFATKAKGLEK